jgi:hypothetical protein
MRSDRRGRNPPELLRQGAFTLLATAAPARRVVASVSGTDTDPDTDLSTPISSVNLRGREGML